MPSANPPYKYAGVRAYQPVHHPLRRLAAYGSANM